MIFPVVEGRAPSGAFEPGSVVCLVQHLAAHHTAHHTTVRHIPVLHIAVRSIAVRSIRARCVASPLTWRASADTPRVGRRCATGVDRMKHESIFTEGPCELPGGEPCEFTAISCGISCAQPRPAVDSCGQLTAARARSQRPTAVRRRSQRAPGGGGCLWMPATAAGDDVSEGSRRHRRSVRRRPIWRCTPPVVAWLWPPHRRRNRHARRAPRDPAA